MMANAIAMVSETTVKDPWSEISMEFHSEMETVLPWVILSDRMLVPSLEQRSVVESATTLEPQRELHWAIQ